MSDSTDFDAPVPGHDGADHTHSNGFDIFIPPWVSWSIAGFGLGIAAWLVWDHFDQKRKSRELVEKALSFTDHDIALFNKWNKPVPEPANETTTPNTVL